MSATAGDGEVVVSWNTVTNATSYNVYWSTASGVSKQTGNRISSVTSPYTLSSLTADISYFFVVTAQNAGGEGQPSAEASATPDAPVAG